MDLQWNGTGKSFLLSVNGNEELRAKVKAFKNNIYIDFRVWVKYNNLDKLYPTKKGVNLTVDEFEKFRDFVSFFPSELMWLNERQNVSCAVYEGGLKMVSNKRNPAEVIIPRDALSALLKKIANIKTIVTSEKFKLQKRVKKEVVENCITSQQILQ